MSAENGTNAREIFERVAKCRSMPFKNSDKLLCFTIGKLVIDNYWSFWVVVQKDISKARRKRF